MNCYVCAQSGKQQAGVGLCGFYGIVLCAERVADVQKHNQSGMDYTSNHHIPAAPPY